ncbi:MAG: histidine phosphatase family protein [Bacteroidia bacterium]
MKKLILVRHAKSDWGNDTLRDIDRPLNERGYDAAYRISEWYKKNHDTPELIISSDATRAISTAAIFARELKTDTAKIILTSKVYEADVATLMGYLKNLPNEFNSVMIFGHNPGFTDLANALNSELFFENVPTCGLIGMELEIKKWSEARENCAKVYTQKFPKEFKQ